MQRELGNGLCVKSSEVLRGKGSVANMNYYYLQSPPTPFEPLVGRLGIEPMTLGLRVGFNQLLIIIHNN
jgi:hypothetical protein